MEQYLTLAEAAEKLNVDRQRLQRWCREGRIPGAIRTPGGHWRIPEDADDHMQYAVGYSPNMHPNEDYRAQGLCCKWEHCIEHQAITGGESACWIFGHDCPGGPDEVADCDPEYVSKNLIGRGLK